MNPLEMETEAERINVRRICREVFEGGHDKRNGEDRPSEEFPEMLQDAALAIRLCAFMGPGGELMTAAPMQIAG